MNAFMKSKEKKMNLAMMVMADCISLEGEIPNGLIDYIKKLSHICELRAVAYKDLASSNGYNNLYNYWHMWQKGFPDATLSSVSLKSSFVIFIE